MDQPLNTLFEHDEGAVVNNADNLAFDPLAHGVFFRDQEPWILKTLFVTEGNPFPLAVKTQHHDVDLVTNLEVLRWMADPSPGDVGDMEEPVEAAEIDKDPIVGEVLHHPFDQLALFEDLHSLLFGKTLLVLENGLPREHHIRTTAIERNDASFDLLFEIVLETSVWQ